MLQQRVDEQQQQITHGINQCRDLFYKLEAIQSHPTRAFEESFLLFKREIEQLISLRQQVEEAVQSRATFFRKLEENYVALFDFAEGNDGDIQAKIHGALQAQHTTDTVALLR